MRKGTFTGTPHNKNKIKVLVYGNEKKWVKGPHKAVNRIVDSKEEKEKGDYMGDRYVMQLEDTSRWQWIDLDHIREIYTEYDTENKVPFYVEGMRRANPKWNYLTEEEMKIRQRGINNELDEVALARRTDPQQAKTPQEVRNLNRKSVKQVKKQIEDKNESKVGGFVEQFPSGGRENTMNDLKKETNVKKSGHASDLAMEKLFELMQEKSELEVQLKKAKEDAMKYQDLPADIKSLDPCELRALRDYKTKHDMLKAAVEMHFSMSLQHMNLGKGKKDQVTLEEICPSALLRYIRDLE